jgi:hypothetical protein
LPGAPGFGFSDPNKTDRVPHSLGLNLALVLCEIRSGPKGGIRSAVPQNQQLAASNWQ